MWVATSLLLVVLAPAPGQNEAAELFQKMEDKVHKAKTIEFESDTVTDEQQKGATNLKMKLAEGNKAKLEMSFEFAGELVLLKGISDGKKTQPVPADKPDQIEDTPRNLGAVFTVMLTRMGLIGLGRTSGGEDPTKADKFDKDKFFAVSDFMLGKKEKIGDVETQAVKYKLAGETDKEKVTVTVWIDIKTNLPVKRVVEITEGNTKTTMTETITTFNLDGKVDPRTFDLPKK